MGQPEGPARPEDKRANFYWADLGFLNYKGAHGPARGASQRGQPDQKTKEPSNFYWADLGFLNYKGAHGPARGASQTRRQKSKFLLGRFVVP